MFLLTDAFPMAPALYRGCCQEVWAVCFLTVPPPRRVGWTTAETVAAKILPCDPHNRGAADSCGWRSCSRRCKVVFWCRGRCLCAVPFSLHSAFMPAAAYLHLRRFPASCEAAVRATPFPGLSLSRSLPA
ncbi:uncharacterized protein Tco025E_03357 [Trypanosoma conorhini]|uniref:Uncharacterized protein n=1 Tax=Trypanosoma conorhini TaxID=83891 RepID=A0A3R7L7T6_9TRYP|nr:uncharacterized protein Tco025E_03357 [Trypanosoma conorhini]RNF21508.1 hypothetical protein Tco025E_03357 [Trypanosoma conorhini]